MSTPNGSVEELLVKISADISGLKSGFAGAGRETRIFGKTVESVDKEVRAFRQQAVGAIQGLGGLENAFDALSGKGALTAGTISQLTQLLPLLTSPVGIVTTAIGGLGIGVMKLVESERKLKENRTAAMLKDVGDQAKVAAAGWDAYFKAIEDGMSAQEARAAQQLAGRKRSLDQDRADFQAKAADLEVVNAKLRERNAELEKGIHVEGPSLFGPTVKQMQEELAANKATIAANEDVIKKGYVPALVEIAGKSKAAADASRDLGDQFKWVGDNIGTTEDKLEAWLALQDIQAENDKEALANLEARLEANAELVQMDLDSGNEDREKKRQEALAQERRSAAQLRDVYADMGLAAAQAFADYASGAEDSEERTKRLTAALVELIVKLLIVKALESQGANPYVAGQLGNIGGSAAGSATYNSMHDGGVVGAHGGYKVGGSPGRDRVPIMAERGERVLSRDQNAAWEAGLSGGGPLVGSITFQSVMPPDRAGMEIAVRDYIVPALDSLRRKRMA